MQSILFEPDIVSISVKLNVTFDRSGLDSRRVCLFYFVFVLSMLFLICKIGNVYLAFFFVAFFFLIIALVSFVRIANAINAINNICKINIYGICVNIANAINVNFVTRYWYISVNLNVRFDRSEFDSRRVFSLKRKEKVVRCFFLC